MNIYEWIKQTFLCIAGEIDIEIAVINHEVFVNGDRQFQSFEFDNYGKLVEWAINHRHKYDIDDSQQIYIGAATGVTIYVKEI